MPVTSGTEQTYGAFRIQNTNNNTLDFGFDQTNGAWLQTGYAPSLITDNVYSLLLNPNGGNVEIGSTVNPRAVKLYTKGNADIMDGSLVFSKPDSGTYNWRVLPNNITTGDLTFQVTSDTNTNETTQASTFVTKLQLTADGRGLSQFTAKAWIQFDGTGTVAITDSHNVSSITDNGTGNYQVHFTNNLANAGYSVTSGDNNYGIGWNDNYAVGSFKTKRVNSSFTLTDTAEITCQIFGD